MKFRRIDYRSLNGKQKEVYNFQKVAAILADYGFNCIKLADDWKGADFLAYHKDGNETLKVQLKGRMTIQEKYRGQGLWMLFPAYGGWCLIEHDRLMRFVGRSTDAFKTSSWKDEGGYSWSRAPEKLRAALRPFLLGDQL